MAGADRARNHLYENIGKQTPLFIEESIFKAKKCGDDWWEEILKDLKEDIVEKYKNSIDK